MKHNLVGATCPEEWRLQRSEAIRQWQHEPPSLWGCACRFIVCRRPAPCRRVGARTYVRTVPYPSYYTLDWFGIANNMEERQARYVRTYVLGRALVGRSVAARPMTMTPQLCSRKDMSLVSGKRYVGAICLHMPHSHLQCCGIPPHFCTIGAVKYVHGRTVAVAVVLSECTYVRTYVRMCLCAHM